MSKPSIRPALPTDAAAIAAIYAPYVSETAISFEETPPTPAEIARRIQETSANFPYLVAELGGAVVAYAYAGEYRTRFAYRFSAEVSAYAAPQAHGRGIGAALYEAVLTVLKADGYHTAVSVITLPNDKSVRFHERMGFEHCGTVRQVGHKFDAWHDTGMWQLML